MDFWCSFVRKMHTPWPAKRSKTRTSRAAIQKAKRARSGLADEGLDVLRQLGEGLGARRAVPPRRLRRTHRLLQQPVVARQGALLHPSFKLSVKISRMPSRRLKCRPAASAACAPLQQPVVARQVALLSGDDAFFDKSKQGQLPLSRSVCLRRSVQSHRVGVQRHVGSAVTLAGAPRPLLMACVGKEQAAVLKSGVSGKYTAETGAWPVARFDSWKCWKWPTLRAWQAAGLCLTRRAGVLCRLAAFGADARPCESRTFLG